MGRNIWGVYMLRIVWVKELLRKFTEKTEKGFWMKLAIYTIM